MLVCHPLHTGVDIWPQMAEFCSLCTGNNAFNGKQSTNISQYATWSWLALRTVVTVPNWYVVCVCLSANLLYTGVDLTTKVTIGSLWECIQWQTKHPWHEVFLEKWSQYDMALWTIVAFSNWFVSGLTNGRIFCSEKAPSYWHSMRCLTYIWTKSLWILWIGKQSTLA